jgi:hypothetical protein
VLLLQLNQRKWGGLLCAITADATGLAGWFVEKKQQHNSWELQQQNTCFQDAEMLMG